MIGSAVPALVAAAAVVALAVHLRPPRFTRPLPTLSTGRRDVAPLGAIVRLGAALRRVVGLPPDPVADRRVGRTALVAAALAVVEPLLGASWMLGASVAPVLRRRRDRRQAARDLIDELPEVVDLLSLATSAGLTLSIAIGVVAEHGEGRLAAELGRARRAADLGAPLADALESLPDRLGEPVRSITRVLTGSLRDGTSVAGALERLAGEVRTERRRAAEERARKVSVRLLFPLVVCVLPAFAVLTVVPLLAGALSGIAL